MKSDDGTTLTKNELMSHFEAFYHNLCLQHRAGNSAGLGVGWPSWRFLWTLAELASDIAFDVKVTNTSIILTPLLCMLCLLRI